MNIKDVLIRVLKKNDQLSEPILHRNEEDEVKHTLARNQEISKLKQLKQVEINCQTKDERSHSNELKRIEKETNERKSELECLRAAARELKEANRLKEAEEEEIARLKHACTCG